MGSVANGVCGNRVPPLCSRAGNELEPTLGFESCRGDQIAAKGQPQLVRNHLGSSGAAALPGLHVMGQTLVALHPAAPQQGKL